LGHVGLLRDDLYLYLQFKYFFSAKEDMKGNATYVMAYETNKQTSTPINK